MNVAPILKGGIRIDIESINDWLLFDLMILDTTSKKHSITDTICEKLKDNEDWNEFVVPDLNEHFNDQVGRVKKQLREERSKCSDSGEIHINKENGADWYGTLNQARIQLEKQFSLHDLNEDDLETECTVEQRTAYLIGRFFTFLQQMIMDEGLLF